MNKKVVGCMIIAMLILGCNASPPAKRSSKPAEKTMGAMPTLSMFRAADQLPGWKEESGTYKEFDPAGLYDIIDGGADFYIDFGLKNGIYQRLKGTGDRQCDMFVEDFGTAENAQKIFNAKKKDIAEPEEIDGFNDSMVVAEVVIGGVNALVRKGNFYFEVLLTGFDDKKRVLEEAGSIVRYFTGISDAQ